MDSGREVRYRNRERESNPVSILVLMDSGREVLLFSFTPFSFPSFNPCFNGFRARSSDLLCDIRQLLPVSILVLMDSGREDYVMLFSSDIMTVVSILVLMDSGREGMVR
mgnify:CR=1 FL=1